MSENRKRYVITYDVENDRLRNLLSRGEPIRTSRRAAPSSSR